MNLNTLPYRLAESVNQTQNVVPTRTLSNYFQGTPLGSALANPTLSPTRVHLKVGRNEHYSLALQHQLAANDVLDIAYVGNRGVHLNGSDDANDPLPGPGNIQARRPYQPWGGINYNTQDVSTTYNSLQAKYEHRASYGLTGLVAYTYSKFLQFNQSPALGGNFGYEYALSSADTPHNLALSETYQLPFGHGRQYMSHTNGFVDATLGGWQLQSIIIVRSGTPYTPVVSGDRANTGVGGQRPNLSGTSTPGFQRSLRKWFDTGRYSVAPLYTYGQVRANTLRSDLYRQFDASVFKNFALPHESVLSFRAEFFNLSNTTSFSAPNATIDASSGGQVTSTSVPSRDIQFALKYNF